MPISPTVSPTVPQTQFAARSSYDWQLRDRALKLGATTRIMAILNVTPDSFSDGGLYASHEGAVRQGLRLLDDGADILDIGGESTRPNATPVSTGEELARVLPVLAAVRRARPLAILSVDTTKAEIAKAAVEAGADIVNDVSGFLWDAAMASTCAGLRCGVVLMHTRGRPQDWLRQPPLSPAQVLPLVEEGLRGSLALARNANIRDKAIVLDPGFGFGKRGDENYVLLAGMPALAGLGQPLLAGVSRKSFVIAREMRGHQTKPNMTETAMRDTATAAAIAATVLAGAHIVRVHNVPEAIAAVQVADALLRHAG